MTASGRPTFSRRRILGATAVAAGSAVSAAALGAGAAEAAPPASTDGPGGAEVAVVTAVAGAFVTVTGKLTGRSVAGVRLQGFPAKVAPRVGDLVALLVVPPGNGGGVVVESGPVAVPVCQWVDGVPTAADRPAGSVCLLDTERADAQVLAVRDAAR